MYLFGDSHLAGHEHALAPVFDHLDRHLRVAEIAITQRLDEVRLDLRGRHPLRLDPAEILERKRAVVVDPDFARQLVFAVDPDVEDVLRPDDIVGTRRHLRSRRGAWRQAVCRRERQACGRGRRLRQCVRAPACENDQYRE